MKALMQARTQLLTPLLAIVAVLATVVCIAPATYAYADDDGWETVDITLGEPRTLTITSGSTQGVKAVFNTPDGFTAEGSADHLRIQIELLEATANGVADNDIQACFVTSQDDSSFTAGVFSVDPQEPKINWYVWQGDCFLGDSKTEFEFFVSDMKTLDNGSTRNAQAKVRFLITPAYPMYDTSVTLAQTKFTYNGKAHKPDVKSVTYNGHPLYEGRDYTVSYDYNVDAGEGWCILDGIGDFYNNQVVEFTIAKAANTLSVKPKTATVKAAKVKKKAQTLKVAKVLTVKGAKGTVTYTKKSGNKKIVVNKKTGKVTLKKGLKKGTYKVKVAVKATGNSNYKAATKTVTFKIKVK